MCPVRVRYIKDVALNKCTHSHNFYVNVKQSDQHKIQVKLKIIYIVVYNMKNNHIKPHQEPAHYFTKTGGDPSTTKADCDSNHLGYATIVSPLVLEIIFQNPVKKAKKEACY